MRLTSSAMILMLIGSLWVAHAAAADSAGCKQGARVTLFDGKSLAGWKVIGCEAEVQDGAILLKAGNGVVRTERTYRDFELEIEWKALKSDKWDSGVFFRCGDPPADRPWPKTYQANLRKGLEGNVNELNGARSEGLVKPGAWNRFRLAVVGTTAALEINGKPAWKADGVATPTGYIALQAEIPGGGQFLFRNIRVRELSAAR
jgi:hypothetical protein